MDVPIPTSPQRSSVPDDRGARPRYIFPDDSKAWPYYAVTLRCPGALDPTPSDGFLAPVGTVARPGRIDAEYNKTRPNCPMMSPCPDALVLAPSCGCIALDCTATRLPYPGSY